MRLRDVLAVFVLVTAFSSALSAFSAVPELDPGNAVSAGMLVGGILLVIRGRKK